MKTFLRQEMAALLDSRHRIVAKRIDAINRRNQAQTELLGDILSHLDDALYCINHELGIKPQRKGK